MTLAKIAFYLFTVITVTTLSLLFNKTQVGQTLEEHFGLPIFFMLKGAQPPPENIAIISLDRESQYELGLKLKIRQWPREIHAKLINELAKEKAAVIGFDIFFREQRSIQGSDLLSQAFDTAGNVALFQYIQLDNIPTNNNSKIQIETLINPLPKFMKSAAALAPFPLPKKPVKISQAWLFKPELGNIPTLPVVMLNLLYPDTVDLLIQLIQSEKFLDTSACNIKDDNFKKLTIEFIGQSLRHCFLANPNLKNKLNEFINFSSESEFIKNRRLLLKFIDIYSGTHSRYLNFYGGRHSINTIPYMEALQSSKKYFLNGKVIFIGYSEKLQTENKDDFDTVYPGETSTFINGVEIIATLFANIIDDSSIRPISNIQSVYIFLIWSIILIVTFRLTSIKFLFFTAGLLSIGYSTSTYFLFAEQNIWLPLITPIFLQLPFILTLILFWRYYDTNRERQRIRDAFSYHLPKKEVDKIANNVSFIHSHSPEMYGICLATDAGQYTALSENIKPEDLRLLMNNYYNAIFEPVRQEEGYISDVVGDAMLAIWAENNASYILHRQSCIAALGIQSAADAFNRLTPSFSLPTRIGLHSGTVVLGHVGAKDHYEYRAVGDIVNTATRIEGLNKVLLTRILVTKNIVEKQHDIMSRDLGFFVLAGKQKPVHIYELIGFKKDANENTLNKNQLFKEGLTYFYQEEWEKAKSIFENILTKYPADGPTQVYLSLCRSLSTPNYQPSSNDNICFINGAIKILKK